MSVRRWRLIGLTLLAAAAAGLLGCASSQGAGSAPAAAANGVAQTRQAAALPGEPACFWLTNFEGSWTVLNDTELIVYAPMFSQPYLIKIFQPVLNLRFDEHLGFEDVEHTGMICNDSQDYLVVPHWTPHRIPIVAVHSLTRPQERELLVANHIRLPPWSRPTKGNQVATR